MNRNILVDALKSIENKLFESAVEDKLIGNPSFVPIRIEVRALRRKLELEQIEKLIDKLESHRDELQAGIDSVKKQLKSLDSAKKVIDQLTGLLGVVGRVISLSV